MRGFIWLLLHNSEIEKIEISHQVVTLFGYGLLGNCLMKCFLSTMVCNHYHSISLFIVDRALCTIPNHPMQIKFCHLIMPVHSFCSSPFNGDSIHSSGIPYCIHIWIPLHIDRENQEDEELSIQGVLFPQK